MAATKVTFTLDQTTISRLEDAAERLRMPKSEVVREAIGEFHARMGRLSERERIRMLRVMDALMARQPSRTAAETDREIAGVREARRRGGRLHRS